MKISRYAGLYIFQKGGCRIAVIRLHRDVASHYFNSRAGEARPPAVLLFDEVPRPLSLFLFLSLSLCLGFRVKGLGFRV